MDEYLNDNGRKAILTLKKINSIYNAIIDADKRMNTENNEKNVYNTLNSIDQVIQDFEFMKKEFSLTTSKKEHGENDITYMLNELNRYTFAGMKYQPISNTSSYDIWTLREETSPSIQSVNRKEITYYNIITFATSSPSMSYTCQYSGALEKNPTFTSAKIGANKYIDFLVDYYEENAGILEK